MRGEKGELRGEKGELKEGEMCVPGGFPEEPFDERAEVPPEQSHQLTHHLHPCQQFVLLKKCRMYRTYFIHKMKAAIVCPSFPLCERWSYSR